MADVIDQAGDASELQVHAATQMLRRAVSERGESHCADCGEEIEAARRAAAPFARRCVPCQMVAERRKR